MTRRRIRLVLAITTAIALAGLVQPKTRIWALQRAGWMLVAEDPVTKAEVVVLTIEVGIAGVLEAADLVKQGFAPRAVVFGGMPDPLASVYRSRGIPYEDNADRLIQDLKAAGVPNATRIPLTVGGTEDQGPTLARWCASQGLSSVIVVTTTDHSRRVRRVLRRAEWRQPTHVMVRVSRYSPFDPNQWWRFRSGIRIQIEETQKLLLDILRHPLS